MRCLLKSQLVIPFLLRMSATILLSWFGRLTEVFSLSSQFIVRQGGYHRWFTGASNGSELTPLLAFIQVLTLRRWIGFLDCGSVVRVPEGTFGAVVVEGGVADLKVIGLSHNILIHSLIPVSQFHKFTGGKLSLVILCPAWDSIHRHGKHWQMNMEILSLNQEGSSSHLLMINTGTCGVYNPISGGNRMVKNIWYVNASTR